LCGLAPAGNKEPHGHSLTPAPPVGWGGASEGKGKLAGQDNSSLTEWQREENNKNTDRKNIWSAIFSSSDVHSDCS